MAYVSRTITAWSASSPLNIPGEDIYPAVSDTDNTNATMSSTTLVTMVGDVADNVTVGDKVTGTGISSSDTVTVVNITDGTAKQFRTDTAVSIGSGVTLSFLNRRNYRWHVDNIEYLSPGIKIKDDETGGIQRGFVTSLGDFTQTITNLKDKLMKKLLLQIG